MFEMHFNKCIIFVYASFINPYCVISFNAFLGNIHNCLGRLTIDLIDDTTILNKSLITITECHQSSDT